MIATASWASCSASTVFAAVCVDARLDLSPLCLGGDVFLGREFAPKLSPRFGVFVASEFAERTAKLGRVGG